MESVATNQGFADGNKRTSVILMHLLLSRSGYRLVPAGTAPTLQDEVETAVLDIVNRDMSFADLVDWFKQRIQRIEAP